MPGFKLPTFKIQLPALLAILGGNSLIKRVLHVPDANLPSAIARANAILVQNSPVPVAGNEITFVVWRAVEQAQQEIVTSGIPDVSINL